MCAHTFSAHCIFTQQLRRQQLHTTIFKLCACGSRNTFSNIYVYIHNNKQHIWQLFARLDCLAISEVAFRLFCFQTQIFFCLFASIYRFHRFLPLCKYLYVCLLHLWHGSSVLVVYVHNLNDILCCCSTPLSLLFAGINHSGFVWFKINGKWRDWMFAQLCVYTIADIQVNGIFLKVQNVVLIFGEKFKVSATILLFA